MPTATIKNTPKATARHTFEKNKVLLSLFNAYIPINAPKATMSIPLASTE
jgi:hypothetical protein